MQPLISPIDHESRHSSNRAEDEVQNASEQTPLLVHRFPRGHGRSDLITILFVGLMIVILLSGFSIGVYLLIIQSQSENSLPPVDNTLKYVSRSHWDEYYDQSLPYAPNFKANCVIIEQTGTRRCKAVKTCRKVLHELQTISNDYSLPYNFLISYTGAIYEGLGWQPSPLYPDIPALILAFIGNYKGIAPSEKQLNSMRSLIVASERSNRLNWNFTVVTKYNMIAPRDIKIDKTL